MTLTDSASIIDIVQAITARERKGIMAHYDIYKKRRVYAVVDKNNNYSLNVEGEEPDGFVDFRQDGSWIPVEYADTPAWLKEQLSESESMEPEEEVLK